MDDEETASPGVRGSFTNKQTTTPMTKRPKKEYLSYAEKLRDPRWQRARLEIMQRDDFKCRQCRDDGNTLNVHHQYYERGLDPWEYPPESLHTLCEDCHEKLEAAKLALLRFLVSQNDFEMALDFAKGARSCLAFMGSVRGFLYEREKLDDELDDVDSAFAYMVRSASGVLESCHRKVCGVPDEIIEKSSRKHRRAMAEGVKEAAPAPQPAPAVAPEPPKPQSAEEILWGKVSEEFYKKYPLQGHYAMAAKALGMEGSALVLGVSKEEAMAGLNLTRPTCKSAIESLLRKFSGHPLTFKITTVEDMPKSAAVNFIQGLRDMMTERGLTP